MKTITVDIGVREFNEMLKQHRTMVDDVKDIKEALLGDRYRQTGVIAKLEQLDQAVKTHDKEDRDNFKKIFDFQSKQILFVGWTGYIIRAVWAGVMVLVGWIISMFF